MSRQPHQPVTGEVYADTMLSSSANSLLVSLLRLLRKKVNIHFARTNMFLKPCQASAPISTVMTEMTMGLMHKILDLEHQIEITSELSSTSDVELFLDFILYVRTHSGVLGVGTHFLSSSLRTDVYRTVWFRAQIEKQDV